MREDDRKSLKGKFEAISALAAVTPEFISKLIV